jgi:hypothetical protein
MSSGPQLCGMDTHTCLGCPSPIDSVREPLQWRVLFSSSPSARFGSRHTSSAQSKSRLLHPPFVQLDPAHAPHVVTRALWKFGKDIWTNELIRKDIGTSPALWQPRFVWLLVQPCQALPTSSIISFRKLPVSHPDFSWTSVRLRRMLLCGRRSSWFR